jgi:hypothetical protein
MMHAGSIEGQAPFTAEGIIARQKYETPGGEGGNQHPRQDSEKGIEGPAVVAKETVESAPVAIADLATGVDAFGDKAVSRGEDPARNDIEEKDGGGLGKEAEEFP